MSEATTHTPDSLADQWSCSSDQIRALIADGSLEAVNIGRGQRRARWIIPQHSVDDFLSRRTNRSKAKPRRQKKPVPQPVREWV